MVIVDWLRHAANEHNMYRCDEAADEIERLREALKEIADFDTYEDISNEECMRDIARNALKEKE